MGSTVKFLYIIKHEYCFNFTTNNSEDECWRSSINPMIANEGLTQSGHTEPNINVNCCKYQRVPGEADDQLAGLYHLYYGEATLRPECYDSCVYKKYGDTDPENKYCFSAVNAIHHP